jgi:hypothetical protein
MRQRGAAYAPTPRNNNRDLELIDCIARAKLRPLTLVSHLEGQR